jgi:5'/3'-nucleotidase SurE
MAAGHNVTIAAPLENQSGAGATLNDAEWIEVMEHAPGVWSVDNTPVGSVIAGLDLIMADNPPDLVISGINFGQNLGVKASTASGTVSAAHMAMQKGVPAIACNLGLLLEEMNETPIPFPSTFASIAPAAQFMARLVQELQISGKDGRLLPPGVMLNINFPVPYGDINGIRFTRLGQLTFFDVTFIDPYNVIPNGGGMVMAYPIFHTGPDPVVNSDTNAYWANYISITVMDGDMSTPYPPSVTNKVKQRLNGLSLN